MKKQVLSLIALLYALATVVSPALADEQSRALPAAAIPAETAGPFAATPILTATPVAAAADPAPAPATASAAAPAAKSMGERIASWPVCIAGFACGTIVGIPVCFVRKMPGEFHNLAHGFVGSITDNEKSYMLIPAGIAWLPFSATAALIEAPAYAWKNAYMAEKPFSKEQFSLGQMDAPDKK